MHFLQRVHTFERVGVCSQIDNKFKVNIASTLYYVRDFISYMLYISYKKIHMITALEFVVK